MWRNIFHPHKKFAILWATKFSYLLICEKLKAVKISARDFTSSIKWPWEAKEASSLFKVLIITFESPPRIRDDSTISWAKAKALIAAKASTVATTVGRASYLLGHGGYNLSILIPNYNTYASCVFILCIILDYKNLKFKHLIDDIAINFLIF